MSKLFIPLLNPIKYHEVTPVQLPQYLSKSIEKYPFIETIEEWEQEVDYPQLWQKTDAITQQLLSGYGPVNMQIIDADNVVKIATNFTQRLQNKQDASQWVYENTTILNSLPKGYYFIKLSVGSSSPTFLISEPQLVCDKIPDSVYLEYHHRSFYGDVFFETGLVFSSRVLGKIKLSNPASKDTIYEDQPLNETLIWSYPYEVYDFLVGGSYGIPDYLIKRLNRVFGCSSTLIDGTAYTKSEGAKWERKSFDDYPLSGWTLELRQAINRASQVYENGTMQARQVSVVAAIDTKGFAISDTGAEVALIDIQ